eukprot:TRINITY_DN1548_c0_g1_i1.p1 TRINITY_DN1548_c0_g1~~TRINITY_DN1548_c0_g1_i1.p1  ORF type:complete len:401 (-),score=65.29 TRINITY_DN1548_c0_g1_i1:317-1465(-)
MAPTATATATATANTASAAQRAPKSPSKDAAASDEFPSLTDLKRSIPAHCFESNALISMLFVVRAFTFTFVLGALLYYSGTIPVLTTPAGRAAVLIAYWIAQGTVLWGWFTLGHDCGHGAFSRHRRLNQVIGILTHTPLFVPYDSWRITHRRHHKNTGNIEKEEIFYPTRQSQETYSTAKGRKLIALLGISWFFYLKDGFPPNYTRHYSEDEPKWEDERGLVHITLVSMWVWMGLVLGAIILLGPLAVFQYYIMPVIVEASWLVVTTFLHHADATAPWYADSEWTYVKGNLSTVDRSYGYLVDTLGHHIGTHQVHHLFPAIPHYHLEEATTHFRRSYPQFVRKSSASIAAEFLRLHRMYVRYGGSCPDNAKLFRYSDVAKTE